MKLTAAISGTTKIFYFLLTKTCPLLAFVDDLHVIPIYNENYYIAFLFAFVRLLPSCNGPHTLCGDCRLHSSYCLKPFKAAHTSSKKHTYRQFVHNTLHCTAFSSHSQSMNGNKANNKRKKLFFGVKLERYSTELQIRDYRKTS